MPTFEATADVAAPPSTAGTTLLQPSSDACVHGPRTDAEAAAVPTSGASSEEQR